MMNETTTADIARKIEQTRKMEADYRDDILAYIFSFQRIVLRGAGGFGMAFAAFVCKHGDTHKFRFWDARSESIQEIHGIPVEQPYRENLDKDTTLIINCVMNPAFTREIGREIASAGFVCVLPGQALLEIFLCPQNESEFFSGAHCAGNKLCDLNICQRLPCLVLKNGWMHGEFNMKNPGIPTQKNT
ncbi:MAG: hypothetical protein LBR88_09115, partial [Zoogloeaceae bacterium]|nr:hypothetical protein [Zoogloeaceae bacterium]